MRCEVRIFPDGKFPAANVMLSLRVLTRMVPFGIAALGFGLTPNARQAQAPSGPAVFTAEQVTAGRSLYAARCAGCHLPDLQGRNEAAPLAGANFMNTWRSRTVGDLATYIQSTMPPGGAGSLSPDDCVNVTAFILAANSAQPGATALTLTTGAPIASVATGTVATAVIGGAPGGAAAGAPRAGQQAGGRPQGPPPPRGLTVAGEVANYVPVTDEMLRNPPPGDWLMARRNYQAWSYSPLTEITRANVKELRLAWFWSMNEAGANQPMPLVHNGIMYLVNTTSIVQALDASTGDLIWENQVGPNQVIGFGSMRNLAIYEDRIFLATTDARLVALDARNGKVIWTTTIADRAKGFPTPQGRS
jgi:alcohol dehydrogenase (cytochrome c)